LIGNCNDPRQIIPQKELASRKRNVAETNIAAQGVSRGTNDFRRTILRSVPRGTNCD
jgi:hypothetical protein